jgi:hypothetical protein
MAVQDRGLPSVAILTINYNSRAYIEEFLASLQAVAYPNYQLVVVDNASDDGSPEEIQWLFPQAVLMRNGENLGVSGGHNVGIRYCLEQRFDYILFLNNDTVVSQDFLDRLVETADERTMAAPKTYLYGRPGLLDDTVGDFDWRRGVWRGWLYGKPEPLGFERPREVSMASLCCLLVPIAVFRDVGLMDERFFMYYEDFDFVARAKAAGYRLHLNPAAVIHHRKAASSVQGLLRQPQSTLSHEEALLPRALCAIPSLLLGDSYLLLCVVSWQGPGAATEGHADGHRRFLPRAPGAHARAGPFSLGGI